MECPNIKEKYHECILLDDHIFRDRGIFLACCLIQIVFVILVVIFVVLNDAILFGIRITILVFLGLSTLIVSVFNVVLLYDTY